MTIQTSLRGLYVPTVTPFRPDSSIDTERFLTLCRWQMDSGADGLAVFGTTSEGNSLSLAEKRELLDLLTESGIPANRLLPGTGACAIPEASDLTRKAVQIGSAGVLVLPPFYYKQPGPDGLFRYYSEIIERVGDGRLRVYLYHIPQMSGVDMPIPLIERLLKAYPGIVVGLKDSSGNWENTKRIIAEVPDLAVFPSSEVFLSEGLELGSAGCISASANIQPREIAGVIAARGTPRQAELQSHVSLVRRVIEGFPLIAAVKAILARDSGDPSWERLRAPLGALTAEQSNELFAALDTLPAYRTVSLSAEETTV